MYSSSLISVLPRVHPRPQPRPHELDRVDHPHGVHQIPRQSRTLCRRWDWKRMVSATWFCLFSINALKKKNYLIWMIFRQCFWVNILYLTVIRWRDIFKIVKKDCGWIKEFNLLFRFITWIDRDPETIARQEALKKRDKLSKDDEERMAEFIRARVR